MLKGLVVCATLAAVLSTSAAAAQEAATGSDEIIVTGERLHEMARSFVEEVAVAPSGERQLARWDNEICPLVAGVPGRQAQYVADRISYRAHQIGLRPEGAGCKANILVFITADADRLAREIVDEHRRLVAYYSETGIHTLGRGPLEEFATTDRPVRWWHVNQTVSGDAQSLGGEQNVLMSGIGRDGPRVTALRASQPASRLRRPTRQDFLRVLIIVDARAAEGLQFQTLADYLAMASLAQLDADGEPSGAPSILNLFAERARGGAYAPGMTAWDEEYLRGLYSARRTAPNAHWQERDIVRRMEEGLVRPAN